MAMSVWIGPQKSYKSYVLVNSVLAGFLTKTERHIFHNLPLNVDEFICDLARTPAVQSEYRRRLHVLEDRETMAFDADGSELGVHHMQKEFWYFATSESVVILDEVADIFSAAACRQRPQQLLTFVNRHAHFGFDVHLACHASSDIDIVVRKKCEFAYFLSNSLRESMVPGSVWFQGIRWPIAFAFVRQYLGIDVLQDLPGRTETIQDEYKVFPRKRKFRNYRSFSHASSMPWLAPKSEGTTTDSYEPSFWRRVMQSANAYRRLIVMAFGVVVAWCLFVKAIRAMMALGTTEGGADVAGWFGVKQYQAGGTNASSAKTNAVAVVPGALPVVPASTVNGPSVVPATVKPSGESERVVFACATFFRTSKGKLYAVGDSCGTNVVSRVLFDGVECQGGRQLRFSDFLLPSE